MKYMKQTRVAALFLIGLMVPAVVMAASTTAEIIKAKLEAAQPQISVDSVVPSAAPGMSAVTISGADGSTEMLYATNDGNFLFTGDMVEVKESGLVNHKDLARGQLLQQVKDEDMVVFAPQGDARAEVFVFTDVDCGYCRKLHTEMPVINALGIKVNYLAFPRSGTSSRTAGKMRSVWCSEDPQEAITKAKQGQNLTNSGTCDNPVNEQYALGVQVGVRGTPAIFNARGDQLGGYLSGQDLAKSLGL